MFDILHRVKKYFVILFFVWVAVINNQLIAQPKLVFNIDFDDEHYGSVEARGIDFALDQLKSNPLSSSGWHGFFLVFTGSEIPNDPAHPPIIGTYSIDDNIIRFHPRFSFNAGLTYTTSFDLSQFYSILGMPHPDQAVPILKVTHSFSPKESIATTFVENIYPSTDILPQNLLKFYIHFTAPMSREDVYKFVYLVDESGKKVKQPFLELEPELWDFAGKRLTIFFDPGRIKRGLRQHQEMGLALKPGEAYRLIIDRELKDAEGNPLVKNRTKKFTVAKADRKSPDPGKWKIMTPGAKSLDPLIINFSESLDHALVSRLLSIQNGADESVNGTIQIIKQETQWLFKPVNYWSAGNYVIHVQTTLEDLAGNNLKRVFDVEVNRKGDHLTDKEAITIPFEIR